MRHKVNTLQTIGVISMSDTTEYRVSLVLDLKFKVRVSVQVWWREDNEQDWNPGKGFNLTYNMARDIVKHLRKSMETTEEYQEYIQLSDSQRYCIEKLIHKDLVVISKSWHKGDYNWVDGKSLALPTHNIPTLASMLDIASKKQLA